MRTKLILLLALLALYCSGAWSDETVTVTSQSALWDANSNGVWTSYTSANWGTTWKSANEKVCVTSQSTGHIYRKASQIATTNVTIWTPDNDVMITGYSIKFKSNAAAKCYIEGATLGVTSTGTSDEQTFAVTGLYSHNAVFKVQTNYANIIDFTITYNTLPTQTAEGYYRIKNTWSGNCYLLAQPASNATKVYKKSATTSELVANNNYVWKITSFGDYKVIQNVGTGRYISNFNTANLSSAAQSGSAVNLLDATKIDDAEVFTFTDRNSSQSGAVAFRGNSKNKNCWLNCWDQDDGNPVGFYSTAHNGDYMLLTRVYKVTFNKDTGSELKVLFSDGNVTAADLDDCYDYSIDGVAKTKNEVVSAINAVTDDNMVIVCSYKRNTTISGKAEIDPTKVYSLAVIRNGETKEKWMYAKNQYDTYAAYFSNANYESFNKNNQWAFVTVDDGNNYYLYNVGQKCFVMSRFDTGNIMDSKFTMRPVTITSTGRVSYPIKLWDGDAVYNENGGNLLITSTWPYTDDGNSYSVRALDGIVFDPTEAQAMINSMSSNIPFVVSPAPSGGSFDEATTWYQISMRPGDGNNGYFAYVPDDYNYESPTQIPLGTTIGTKSETDNYRWCITGSFETGYRLYNKKAGADKVFVFNSSNGGKMLDYSGNESTSLFYLVKSGYPSALAAPTFVFKNTASYRPNRNGTTHTIGTYGYNDTGSEFGFTFDEDYEDNNFYIEYAEIVKPYMDDELSSQYFHLTNAKQKENIWNAPTRYSDGVEHAYYSHDDVIAMRTAVEAYLKKPVGTLAVRLKNTNSGEYVSYDTQSQGGTGLFCHESFNSAEADLTSVFQFIPIDATTYYIYMPAKDKYVGSQTSGDIAFPLVDEEERAVFSIATTNTPGKISIYNTSSYVNTNNEGYLHSAGWAIPGVVNWKSANESSYWNIEDAETISIDLISPIGVDEGEDVYMTYVNRLGLPLKAPENASVWTVSSQNTEKVYAFEVVSKDIPAGNGVIIKAEKGSTIHMNIKSSTSETLDGNILIPGDGSTIVAAGNYMLAYSSTDEIAKFYAIGASGFVVPTNKAYLPAIGNNVKELKLFFIDDETDINTVNGSELLVNGSIYNLSGQRLSKMQKGINIVNGKKVLF